MNNLHYQEKGTGQILVLLPGFCESLSIWDAIVPAISKTCHVIAIDLPGFGGSSHITAPTSINQAARQIHQLVQSLNVEQYIVAGHSLGGYISFELARLYPDAVLGIGLIHSTAFTDDDDKIKSRKKVIEFVRNRGVEVFINSFVPQLFADKMSPNITAVINLAKNTPIQSLINYTLAMIEREDSTNTLSEWTKPLRFIAGEQDSIVTIDKSRAHLSHITADEYVEIPEVGHMGMIEAPSKIEKVLSDLVCTVSK